MAGERVASSQQVERLDRSLFGGESETQTPLHARGQRTEMALEAGPPPKRSMALVAKRTDPCGCPGLEALGRAPLRIGGFQGPTGSVVDSQDGPMNSAPD